MHIRCDIALRGRQPARMRNIKQINPIRRHPRRDEAIARSSAVHARLQNITQGYQTGKHHAHQKQNSLFLLTHLDKINRLRHIDRFGLTPTN